MSYYCNFNHCKLVSGEILKQLGPINQRVEANSQRISVLEETVQKQDITMEVKIKEEVNNVVSESIDEKVKQVWELEKDRALRTINPGV